MTVVHSRADWGARSSRGSLTPLTPSRVEYIALHWPGSVGRLPIDDVEQQLRNWQRQHQVDRGWRDIAYNEGVDLNGEVWTLRGDNVDGSVSNMGGRVYSILCIYGTKDEPTLAMLQTIVERVARAKKKYPNAKVVGHRTLKSTDCPGDAIYSWLKAGMPLKDAPPIVLGSRLLSRTGQDAGPDVVQLIAMLNQLGYNLAADGLFGPAVEAAVKDFQTRRELAPDGIVGPLTVAALLDAVSGEDEDEEPAPEPEPDPEPAARLFRFGLANWEAERWGGLDDNSNAPGEYMRDVMRCSLYVLNEVSETRRNAIRRVLNSKRYLVHPAGYVANMWDSQKWQHADRVDADTVSLGTNYHFGIRSRLRDLTGTDQQIDIIGMHTRPSVSFGNVSAAKILSGKLNDIRRVLDKLLREGKPTIFAGDFNTGRAVDVAKEYGLVRATPAEDTLDKAGDQNFDAVFVTPDLGVRGHTLLDPGNRTDHKVWVYNGTLYTAS